MDMSPHNNKLTVIIPFLNEGIEVKRTVESVCQHIKGDVDILVINDGLTFVLGGATMSGAGCGCGCGCTANIKE